MKYVSPKEAAARWRINERTVRRYCEKGLIHGAAQVDGLWIIPDDTPKPKNIDTEPPIYTGPAKQVVAQRAKNNHFGIYEYLQVNLAYSSSRMASNRLTRNQILELYRTGKISVAFEPMKIDDIYEIDNHFRACTYVIDNLLEPLHTAHLRKLHSLLFYGTEADRNGTMRTGEFRANPHKYGLPPEQISKELGALIKEYEAKKKVQLTDILDFHVRFERIHPFEDGNGRLGRLIMTKECLRHQIVPFVIDDKHRGEYHKGIAFWDTNPEILTSVTTRAQSHFDGKMDLCRLFQYQRPVKPK
jgi:hypothetical protein